METKELSPSIAVRVLNIPECLPCWGECLSWQHCLELCSPSPDCCYLLRPALLSEIREASCQVSEETLVDWVLTGHPSNQDCSLLEYIYVFSEKINHMAFNVKCDNFILVASINDDGMIDDVPDWEGSELWDSVDDWGWHEPGSETGGRDRNSHWQGSSYSEQEKIN